MNLIHGWIETGGLIFWGLVFAELAILIRCMVDSYGKEIYEDYQVQSEPSGLIATGSIVIFAAILFVFGDWNLVNALRNVKDHIYWYAGLVASYIAIGIPWSIFQAYWAASVRGVYYRLIRMDWLHNRGITDATSVPDQYLKEWQKFVQTDNRLIQISKGLTYRGQSPRIVRTLAYWPLSMVWFLFANLLNKGFQAICMRLCHIYQKVMDFAHADISEDFRKPSPEE